MRPVCKHFVYLVALVAASGLAAAPAAAKEPTAPSAGGVAIGDSQGGVTDRAYVVAPPNYLYVLEKESGSFLDCGEGLEQRAADASGRDLAALSCGVTLTETIVIPAASESARLIVHY